MDLSCKNTLYISALFCFCVFAGPDRDITSGHEMRRSKLTLRLPSLPHHGISLTRYRWSPVWLCVCLSIKADYAWGPAAKSQLLQGCVMGLILTHMNGSQVECQLKWSHCRSNCEGLCDFKRHGLGVYFCMCVWMWKVNTVGSAAALWTLSLFSSQRSVWKAYCMNLGVSEWAVSPLQTPPPLLNL